MSYHPRYCRRCFCLALLAHATHRSPGRGCCVRTRVPRPGIPGGGIRLRRPIRTMHSRDSRDSPSILRDLTRARCSPRSIRCSAKSSAHDSVRKTRAVSSRGIFFPLSRMDYDSACYRVAQCTAPAWNRLYLGKAREVVAASARRTSGAFSALKYKAPIIRGILKIRASARRN